jgi:hypothetical protein
LLPAFIALSGVQFASPPANGKQGLIRDEMSQTLLTNKKQGTWTPLTLLNQRKLAFTFCVIKSLEPIKKLKKLPRTLFRPKTNHTCHQRPNISRERFSLKREKFNI